MSLESMTEFWLHIRRLVPHSETLDDRRVPRSRTLDDWANAPPTDYRNHDVFFLTTARAWDDPTTVADYSEADYQFLDQAERAELKASVADFLTAIRTPEGTEPNNRRTRAAQALVRIVRLFAFDRYFDPLAFYLGKRIEERIAPHRPANLVALKYISGQDSDDEPVLRIWGMLDEPDEDRFAAQARTLKEIVFEAALAVDRKRWPHVRFWHTPETASPKQEPADEQAVPS